MDGDGSYGSESSDAIFSPASHEAAVFLVRVCTVFRYKSPTTRKKNSEKGV
jgi:hypothetical protein